MSNCVYYSEDHGTCVNADSPFCADFCPVLADQWICTFAENAYPCSKCKHNGSVKCVCEDCFTKHIEKPSKWEAAK